MKAFCAALLCSLVMISATVSCADTPAPAIQQVILSADEARMIELANWYRDRIGLAPLVADAGLIKTSRQHTHDMATWKGMRHGGTVGWRGEIIAHGQSSPAEAIEAWLRSPGHRRLLCSSGFRYCGAARVGNFWTMQFR
jgi:uncharacterized protein YkwD